MSGYVIAIILIVILGNAIIVFSRYRRNRVETRDARESRIAAVRRNEELMRRDEHEQEDAAKRVELRNQTLGLYEKVRRRAETNDEQDPEGNARGAGTVVGAGSRPVDGVRGKTEDSAGIRAGDGVAKHVAVLQRPIESNKATDKEDKSAEDTNHGLWTGGWGLGGRE